MNKPSAVSQLRAFFLATFLGLAATLPIGAQAGNDSSLQSRQSQTSHRTYAQVGLASWYGRESEGRPTASGQSFNPGELTAAHKTLPLGTVVRVTNLSTGKVVKVRVNDRGPYVGRRILDLSAAAGETLKIRKYGVVLVRVEVFPSDQKQAPTDARDME
jgi:rare lipoprotein A